MFALTSVLPTTPDCQMADLKMPQIEMSAIKLPEVDAAKAATDSQAAMGMLNQGVSQPC